MGVDFKIVCEYKIDEEWKLLTEKVKGTSDWDYCRYGLYPEDSFEVWVSAYGLCGRWMRELSGYCDGGYAVENKSKGTEIAFDYLDRDWELFKFSESCELEDGIDEKWYGEFMEEVSTVKKHCFEKYGAFDVRFLYKLY